MRGLSAVVVGAVVALAAGCSDDAPLTDPTDPPADAHAYVTRPDLTPPVMRTTVGSLPHDPSDDAAEGNVIALGPKDEDQEPAMQGALLVDPTGEPVWVSPMKVGPFDVRVQEYKGAPVLTYWEGTSTESGSGAGRVTLLDTHYRQVATVTTGGDVGAGKADIHETTITPDDTILLTAYVPARADLTAVGGPKDGWVQEGVAQEVDIATGKVLWEWRSLDHVPVAETYSSLPKDEGTQDKPFDYFHLNAVALDGDGAFLLSARNTHTVYKADRSTGKVDWHLGGKEDDFVQGAQFAWQHDIRLQDDGTLTLFDNEGSPRVGPTSRGLRLTVDEKAMTTTMVAEYLPPAARHSDTQGNVQVLPDGNVLVGWGQRPYLTEYDGGGTLIGELTFSSGSSYRAYRQTWHATPTDPPDVVVQGDAVHVSWNGATDVASWRVVTGADEASAKPVATAAKKGFETTVHASGLGAYVAVQALDADGAVLGTGTPAK
ncbi:arylsulfotransferase family protein [Luteimicrobium sp. DT211]|uniref:arylsulfotransferase family protein n=1 Tax=Luteimicrobium sp. DT211 TaxID=3393412 RepID=UPI003CF5AD7A